jgi:hypothetical protein
MTKKKLAILFCLVLSLAGAIYLVVNVAAYVWWPASPKLAAVRPVEGDCVKQTGSIIYQCTPKQVATVDKPCSVGSAPTQQGTCVTVSSLTHQGGTTNTNVSETDVEESGFLTFQVTYIVPLSQQRTLTVLSIDRPWVDRDSDDVSFLDRLTQANGNEIYFGCDNIADKIIIPSLVEEVRPYCKQIHTAALAYWASINYVPDEFEDKDHTHWRKVK